MESQKETSVSLEEIEASSQELMQLAEDTKKTTGRKTSFKRQADALARKHASFYKRSWTTLVIQLIIPLVFMLCKLFFPFLYFLHFERINEFFYRFVCNLWR